MRQILPNRRLNQSLIATVNRNQVHFTFGYDANGDLAEVFVDSHKVGTAMQEMMQTAAMLVSSGLQHGTPAAALIDMLRHSPIDSVSGVLADLMSRPDIARWAK